MLSLQKSLILICLAFATLVSAQDYSLSGYIKDAKTGEELIAANVSVVELTKGVSANVYGFYSLSLPKGTHDIKISFIGYNSKVVRVDLQQNMTMNFDLEERSQSLSAVVLSDKKADENIKSVEISTVRIDPKQMKKVPVVLGEQDIIKSFTLQPGITTAREGASGFNVRGGKEDQNLILLDESAVFSSSHLLGFFSVFNSDAIKDATMYKGGIPAYYGGRLSSVLDIRQKEGNMKAFHGTGGIGALSARLMLEGPFEKDKGSFMVAGRRSYGDLFLKLSKKKELRESKLYFYDLNAKGNYIINDKNRLFLSGYFGRDVFKFDDNFGVDWGNTNFTLRWNHLFSPKLFSNTSLIYSKYNYELGIADIFNWRSEINSWSLTNDYQYFKNDKNSFKFGFTAKKYNINLGEIDVLLTNEDTLLGKRLGIEPAVYVSHKLNVNPRFDIEYGLRLAGYFNVGEQEVAQYTDNKPIYWDEEREEYISRLPNGFKHYGKNDLINYDIRLLPRLRLRYALDDESSLKVGYNRMMQNLHLISNATSSNPLNIWLPNDRYIDPEMVDQMSAGYFRNFDNNKYELSTELYYKYYSNLIDYKDLPNLDQNPYIEAEILAGNGRAFGLELSLKKTQGKLTGWLSYTLARTETRIEGFGGTNETGINKGNWYPSAFDKTHDLSITGIYELSDRLSVSANFVFATGLPANFPSSSFQFGGITHAAYNGYRNQDRMPVYHRVDLGATLKGKKHKNPNYETEWIFGVYNAYNRYNTAGLAFVQDEETGENQVESTTYFGIIPSVTWNFKF
ncbi:MAG: TonB-dependent receptor [Flavobacteriales bacterium]